MAGRTTMGSRRKGPKNSHPCWVKGPTSYLQLRAMRPGKTAEDKRIGAWKGGADSDPPPSDPEDTRFERRMIRIDTSEVNGERNEESSGKTYTLLQQGGNARRPQEGEQAWVSEAQETLLNSICLMVKRSSGVERRPGPVRREHQTGYAGATSN